VTLPLTNQRIISDQPEELPVYVHSRGEGIGAVVTLPPGDSVTTGVILVAGRARDRAHRNGMWVKAAAALAREGVYVMRLDYPGVGNSTGEPQVFSLEKPPAWAVKDAARFLLEHTPVKRILLVGTCYGARLILASAVRIPEVFGVGMIAAPTFVRIPTFWRRLWNRIRDRLRWRREDAAPNPAVAIEQSREGNLAAERRVSPEFARSLRAFLRRGRIWFLYGEDDYMYDELRFALERLRPPADRYELEVVPGAIHVFRTVAIQEMTVDRVVAWCSRMLSSPASARR
jgi:pimeloyl-ACP methyl ester carboxylesterase